MFYCAQFHRTCLIPIDQRHKLGSNLTPVTPETFAKWKKTRMDKKEAEQEASRKAKEAQNAAGKNVGMSGRDLVSWNQLSRLNVCLKYSPPSSNTIQSGSKTRKTTRKTIGILRNTDSKRNRKTWPQRRSGLLVWHWRIPLTSDIYIYNIQRVFNIHGTITANALTMLYPFHKLVDIG